MRRSPNLVHRLAIHREIWGEDAGDNHALIRSYAYLAEMQ